MSTLVTTALRHNASASNNMVLDSSGRVGIGTATPANQLHIVGNSAARLESVFALDIRPGTSDFSSIAWKSANGAATFANIGPETVGSGSLWVNGATNIYLATGSTERMRIDASGRITNPSQPGFYANGPAQNYVLGNQGNLNLSNAVYNIGGHYNTSTFRFTAPVAGRYLFTWSVFNNSATGRCSLKVNGGAYADLQMDAGAGLSQSAILNLNANDFVSVGDWQNISGLNYWGSHSHFSGILLA